jgi:hypothetical protein
MPLGVRNTWGVRDTWTQSPIGVFLNSQWGPPRFGCRWWNGTLGRVVVNQGSHSGSGTAIRAADPWFANEFSVKH